MQAFRALFAILPLFLLAGSLLLLILTLLSGGVQKNPINEFFYLDAALTVPGIDSPDGRVRFTNYNICGVQNGRNVNCGPTKAAFGFNPVNDISSSDPSLPAGIVANNSKSKTTSKAYYSFLIIAAFFTMVAMFTSIIACFGRIGAFIGFITTLVAWATCAIAASLMTVVYVRARNEFRAGGISANLGVKLFAFMWTTVAATGLALLILSVGVCIPGDSSRRRNKRSKRRSYQEKPLVTDNESYHPVQSAYTAPEPTSVYEEGTANRSSYERATPRTAAPLDGHHTTGESGATYLR